jgi:hypothetical protein
MTEALRAAPARARTNSSLSRDDPDSTARPARSEENDRTVRHPRQQPQVRELDNLFENLHQRGLPVACSASPRPGPEC